MICCSVQATVSAKNAPITSTLNIAATNQNSKGNGYVWDNLNCILTLTDCEINTEDDYGLKLPANSVVELNGNNIIKASVTGIHCLSSVTFSGSGTLTVIAGNAGIICASTSVKDTVRFRSGKLSISSDNYGIYSENAILSFTGAEVSIHAAGYSVYGNDLQFVSGTLDMTSSVNAKGKAEFSGANVTVTSDSAAVTAVRGISISGCNVSVGSSPEALSAAESYNGESCLKLVSTVKNVKTSKLFGENIPAFVDYIVVILLVLLIAAVIIVPIYIKARKTKRLASQSERKK